MIFHDSTKKKLFLKHQNKLNFKNLDAFEVLSIDFPGLKTSAVSMASTASRTSVASMTSATSFHEKKIMLLIVGYSLATQWPILVLFCWMDYQKSKFSLKSAPFLSEAAEVSWYYFFKNWLLKLKFPCLSTSEPPSNKF